MNSETSLKPAIRKLIHSSQVKPEAVGVIIAGLENENVTAEDWQNLFNKEGAEIAIKQKIYSPQMVRLITLRAIVIPETLPQFLVWLNIQRSKKPDQHQTISLELQKDIGLLFPRPQERLRKGINYLLLDLLNQKISVDSLYWLLATQGSVWVYGQKQFIADIQNDLQLIHNHFSSPKTASKTSSYPDPNSVFTTSSSVGSENDSWQNDFKCQKQIWATLINSWQGIRQGYRIIEEYQPFAELLARLKEYNLAAYFYQVSDGIVDKDLYDEVANQQHRPSPVVFGLRLEPKKNLIDHVVDFITQEYIVPIQFVIPLSLLILVSGWFIGTKNWESYTSATDIEKSLCSKTFQKDGKNCPVIVLDPKTSYGFSEIKQLIPAVVNDVVNEKTNQNPGAVKTTKEDIRTKVLEKLEGFIGSTRLKYEDLDPGKEPTDLKIQKQWITAIYNYQIKRNVTYQKIADQGNENNQCNLPFGICLWPLGQNNDTSNSPNNVENSALYKKLKGDILAAMKPQQPKTTAKNNSQKQQPKTTTKNNSQKQQPKTTAKNNNQKQQPKTTTKNNNQKEVNKNELGDKQRAIKDYTQAIKINPNDADAYYNRGIVRYQLGDKQGAIDDYTQAIKINPNLALAYVLRGSARYELGDKPGAIDDYTQAIKINPNLALAYYVRGIVRDELGDKQGAIADYTQAIKINPKDADAYYNRGVVRDELGDKQEAIDDFQQAAKLYQQQGKNQDYQDALNRIKELQQ
jgi:tetratricopeptide (TPR) repeat protein